jgi:hypothetical protein
MRKCEVIFAQALSCLAIYNALIVNKWAWGSLFKTEKLVPWLLCLVLPEAGGGPALLYAKDDPLSRNPQQSAARLGLLEFSGLRSGFPGFEKRAPCPRP